MAELVLVAGKPFAQTIRVPDAKTVWLTLDQLEVRSQLRTGPGASDALIANLHSFMTWSFDGDDLVILWVMSGLETRVMYDKTWGAQHKGYFTIVISDLGVVDSRALVTPLLSMRGVDNPTVSVGAV